MENDVKENKLDELLKSKERICINGIYFGFLNTGSYIHFLVNENNGDIFVGGECLNRLRQDLNHFIKDEYNNYYCPLPIFEKKHLEACIFGTRTLARIQFRRILDLVYEYRVMHLEFVKNHSPQETCDASS